MSSQIALIKIIKKVIKVDEIKLKALIKNNIYIYDLQYQKCLV